MKEREVGRKGTIPLQILSCGNLGLAYSGWSVVSSVSGKGHKVSVNLTYSWVVGTKKILKAKPRILASSQSWSDKTWLLDKKSYSTALLSTQSLTQDSLKLKVAASMGLKAMARAGKPGQHPFTAKDLRALEFDRGNKSSRRTGLHDRTLRLSLERVQTNPQPMPLDQSEMRLAVSAGLDTTSERSTSRDRSA